MEIESIDSNSANRNEALATSIESAERQLAETLYTNNNAIRNNSENASGLEREVYYRFSNFDQASTLSPRPFEVEGIIRENPRFADEVQTYSRFTNKSRQVKEEFSRTRSNGNRRDDAVRYSAKWTQLFAGEPESENFRGYVSQIKQAISRGDNALAKKLVEEIESKFRPHLGLYPVEGRFKDNIKADSHALEVANQWNVSKRRGNDALNTLRGKIDRSVALKFERVLEAAKIEGITAKLEEVIALDKRSSSKWINSNESVLSFINKLRSTLDV